MDFSGCKAMFSSNCLSQMHWLLPSDCPRRSFVVESCAVFFVSQPHLNLFCLWNHKMRTPFDDVIDHIKRKGFHNHRLETHSDAVSGGILRDLAEQCDAFRGDIQSKAISAWLNVKTPGARHKKIDLLVAEPNSDGTPNLERVRLCVENKSVVTAHRNRDGRFDDLNEALKVLHGVRSEAVLVATVIVGMADRVLNVPDRIKPFFKNKRKRFETKLLPRLSTGDATLWDEFDWAISRNGPDDPVKTVAKFQQLPKRKPGLTHIVGYDYVLLVPMHIDNVGVPYIPRPNRLGIDVDEEYEAMLMQVCKTYSARWHL